MPDSQTTAPGGAAPPSEATADDVRKQVLRLLSPAAEIGVGRSILDRLLLVGVAVHDQPTAKNLRRSTGLDADVVRLVVDGLVDVGALRCVGSSYQLRQRFEQETATEDELDQAWLVVELTARCPTCKAGIGVGCLSNRKEPTSPHTARRKAALNPAPAEGIAA